VYGGGDVRVAIDSTTTAHEVITQVFKTYKKNKKDEIE
jgi:hypothetical protein